MKSFEERFWKKVSKTSYCWIWNGSKNEHGYGLLGVFGKTTKAHRVSYELANGTIPKGLLVCHSCDNPPCVNPDHLFLGTMKDNVQDSISKRRFVLVAINPMPGEANPRSKLTAKNVIEIRRSNEASTILAKRFSVSRKHIYAIKSGKKWKHSFKSETPTPQGVTTRGDR